MDGDSGDDTFEGTAAAPWKTITKALATLQAGQAAYVHAPSSGNAYAAGGETNHSGDILTGSGKIYWSPQYFRFLFPDEPVVRRTVTFSVPRPIWLIAEPGVVLKGSGTDPILRLKNAYWVIQGFDIDASGVSAAAIQIQSTHHVVTRNTKIHDGNGGAAVYISATSDVGVFDGEIWGTEKKVSSDEWTDAHGIMIQSGAARVYIKGMKIHSNYGDGIQCASRNDDNPAGGQYTAAADDPADVTIESNVFGKNEENAVDLKSCQRVTLRANFCSGYRPTNKLGLSSSIGDVFVVHANARDIVIEGNTITDSSSAASVGASSGQVGARVGAVAFRRNIVYKMVTDATAGPLKNGQSTGCGIRVGLTDRIEVYHNTFSDLEHIPPYGGLPVRSGYAITLGHEGTIRLAVVFNNIIAEAGGACRFYTGSISKLATGHNLYFNASKLRGGGLIFWDDSLATWIAKGYDCGSLEADPRFVKPSDGNFFTRIFPPSPALDRALRVAGSAGVTILGGGPDMGALESG